MSKIYIAVIAHNTEQQCGFGFALQIIQNQRNCNFAEILFASMCLGKNCMMPFFARGHAIAWVEQAELVLKKVSLINIRT